MYVVYAAGQFAYEDPLVGILGRFEWHSALLCNSHKIWNTDTLPWCGSHTTRINGVYLSPIMLLRSNGLLMCLPHTARGHAVVQHI